MYYFFLQSAQIFLAQNFFGANILPNQNPILKINFEFKEKSK
jgi:hypothetical protein